MELYGLIGRGISHSFSANFFNKKFAEEAIDAVYYPFDLPDIDRLPELLRKHPNLKGINVTSPYKREVIPFLHRLSPEAELLQAVNVIKIIQGSEGLILEGHNTDWKGFGLTLPDLLTGSFENDGRKKALIMGTGGASSAVALALSKEGVSFSLVSRTPDKSDPSCISYSEMNDLLPSHLLLINSTPLGMHPHEDSCPAVDFSKIGETHVCYDLIYNPPVTQFLKKSAERNATVKNGLDMLINQANLSWDIWQKNS